MNPIKHLACFSVVALLVASPRVEAGSIDYLSNQSGQFIGNFAKNASTRGADTSAYNPAGLSFLDKKLYINLSTQTVIKDFWITYQGEEYHSEVPTPLVPALHVVGKPLEDLAIYGSFTIPAGGGSLEFGDGVPFLRPLALVANPPGASLPRNAYFEGSSIYYGATVGASYKFLDMISISAAARLIIAGKTYKGQATYDAVGGGETTPALDASKDAIGVGGIFGVHVRPIKYLDIGLRFETETSLDFKTTSNINNYDADGKAIDCDSPVTPTTTGCNMLDAADNAVASFRDGHTEKRNLPMILGIGLSVHPIDDLDINLAFNYYFTKEADEYEDVTGATGYARGYDDDYDNGYDVAASIAYRFIPEFELTLGFNHTTIGGNSNTYNDFEFSLDSNSVGFSARASVHEQLDLTLGFSATLYGQGTNEAINPLWNAVGASFGDPNPEGEQFNREVFAIGFGIEWAPDI